MAYLGFFVGAFFTIWVISRITRRLFFRKSTGWTRAISPNVLALSLATGIGGLGMADGGSPQFFVALAMYLPPAVILVVVDTLKGRRTETEPPSGS